MLTFLLEYGMFLLKAITVIISIIIIVASIVGIVAKGKKMNKEHLEANHLNKKYQNMLQLLKGIVLSPELKKLEKKEEKKKKKEESKEEKNLQKKAKQEGKDYIPKQKKRMYVIHFDGDIKASAVTSLKEEVTAVLGIAKEEDEVFVRLDSSGGVVHSYGLAASQLQRIKDKKIPLTVSVDKVAASGGYMMACIADKIIAAPFAILGSIGVVAQLPNFNKLLKKNHVDFELFTAGKYKRTVTLFGENNDEGREKFKEELEETHILFKSFVKEARPTLDIEKIATGEHWFGKKALELNLIDALQTGDDYLAEAYQEKEVYEVKFVKKQNLSQKLAMSMQEATDAFILKWFNRTRQKDIGIE